MAIIRRGQPQEATLSEWSPIVSRLRELVGWDPFAEIAEMAPWAGGRMSEFQPRFEIKETKDAYVFKADLPGVEDKDVEVSLTGNRLTVSGRRQSEERRDDERYFAYECSYGSFTRSFTLPEGVDGERVDAEMKNGVLKLVVPKLPETQPRKIALGGKQGDKAKAKA